MKLYSLWSYRILDRVTISLRRWYCLQNSSKSSFLACNHTSHLKTSEVQKKRNSAETKLAGSEAEKRWHLLAYRTRIICICCIPPPANLTVNMIYGPSVVFHGKNKLLLENACTLCVTCCWLEAHIPLSPATDVVRTKKWPPSQKFRADFCGAWHDFGRFNSHQSCLAIKRPASGLLDKSISHSALHRSALQPIQSFVIHPSIFLP